MTDQFPTDPSQYSQSSQATTALVLGILSLVLCQVLGPFAWVMGKNEVEAIDAGRRDPANRGTANAGKILGIIATVMLAIGIILGIAFIAALVASGEIN